MTRQLRAFIDPGSGSPEIRDQFGTVIAVSGYRGLATYLSPTEHGVFYLVASDYWQGTLPTGVLCRLEVLSPKPVSAPAPTPDPDALYQPNTEQLENLLWEFANTVTLGMFGHKPKQRPTEYKSVSHGELYDVVRDLAIALMSRR
jgi:hypothetical protein